MRDRSLVRRATARLVVCGVLLIAGAAAAATTPRIARGNPMRTTVNVEVPLGQTVGGFTFSSDGTLGYKGGIFSPPVTARTDSIKRFKVSVLSSRKMASAIGWDEDGQHTLFLLNLMKRTAVSFQTGTTRWVAAVRTFWSPSGKYLLALCSYEGQRFLRANLDSGEIKEGDFLRPAGDSTRRWRVKGDPTWVGRSDVLTFTAEEMCDPYNDGCAGTNPESILAVHQVAVDAGTLTTRMVATRPAGSSRDTTTPAAGASIVVAGFQTDDGRQFVLCPFVSFEGGRFEGLFQNVDEVLKVPLAKEDSLPSGGWNPSSGKIREAIGKSILNRVRRFAVYRKGKRVGTYKVTESKVMYIGAVLKVVGVGIADGFVPAGDELAIAGGNDLRGLWRTGKIAETVADRAKERAFQLFPQTIPAHRNSDEKRAECRLVVTTVQGKAIALDLGRNGNTQVLYQGIAGVSCGDGQYEGSLFLLMRDTAEGDPLLSSAAIFDASEMIYGDKAYGLLGVVDIDNDGKAEVILTSATGEAADLEIWSFAGDHMIKRCTVMNWSGS